MKYFEVRRTELRSFHAPSIRVLEAEVQGDAWRRGAYPVLEFDSTIAGDPGCGCEWIRKTAGGIARFRLDGPTRAEDASRRLTRDFDRSPRAHISPPGRAH